MNNSDSGNNLMFYLNIGLWYRTISPYDKLSNTHGQIIRISSSGSLGYNWVDDNGGGGVQTSQKVILIC